MYAFPELNVLPYYTHIIKSKKVLIKNYKV